MNLADTSPRPDLSSTGYCLANPGREYLVYVPFGYRRVKPYAKMLPLWTVNWVISRLHHSVSVDLSEVRGTMTVEWFNPSTGEILTEGTISAGSSQDFTAPFPGDALLYLTASGIPGSRND